MPTIDTIIRKWTAYRSELRDAGAIAKTTYQNQAYTAGYLVAGLGHFEATELRKSHLDIWTARRLQNHKPVTVHSEMVIFRQILTWAIDEKILTELPRFPTISVPNVEYSLPEDSDFIWYLTNLPPQHSTALEFMLLTGLAPHELDRLQGRDFDPEGIEIHIGRRKDFFVKQESRRRAIPLNARAAAIWTEAATGAAPTARVFPKPCAIQKAMRRLFLARPDAPPKADGLTPKMMRKWFASRVSSEYAEEVLQRLLGHAPGSPITRKHYVRSTDTQRREATGSISIGAE